MDLFFDILLTLELLNPFQAFWLVFINGGWIILAIVLMKGLWLLWLDEIQGGYASELQFMMLAINVPRQTEQSPKAVENIFAHLTGLGGGGGNLVDKYWKGKFQEQFSCEIVSRSGYIQYFVYLPSKYRDVLEASIFAQYPDAEIVEVTDYLDEMPKSWPDERYDMWGAELALSKSYAYPIKTHPGFVDQVSGLLKDPLSSMLEFLSTLRPGEEAYIQFALRPTGDDWRETCIKEINKLIGAKVEEKKSEFQKFIGRILNPLYGIIEEIIPFLKIIVEKKEGKEEPPNKMQYLPPGDRSVVEQISIKASKPAFTAKIRLMYVAPKEIFNKSRAGGGLMGSFKQVSTMDMNSFTTEKFTKLSADYFFVEQRILKKQNAMWAAFRGRSLGCGGTPYVLNVEELATLWHFPMIDTKAPLVSKATSKQAEPPSSLPVRDMPEYGPGISLPPLEEKKDELPENLPFV
jgi:hypothetical protein